VSHAASGTATLSGASAATAGLAIDVNHVRAGYGRFEVLHGVDLTVARGEVVALLGSNGAGKTTLLRTIAGLLPTRSGRITINGVGAGRGAPFRRVREGLCLIPEGRGVFPSLTVRDNLRMQVPRRGAVSGGIERALAAFPRLGERIDQVAGTMSGGEQQMLALARAWCSSPSVVMVDELSMGLAPRIVDDLFAALRVLAADGVALLVVEQYVHQVLPIADRAYILDKGEIAFAGRPADLDQEALLRGYLGGAR
jgi:branched-chain amino acid transport system ATP-binding protein